MIQGIKKFKCNKCGHVFMDIDMEAGASSLSASVKCPKCGNMTNDIPSLLEKINKK